MASISEVLSHFPNIPHLAPSPSFTANSNQLYVRTQTENKTDFSFVTAEGDRVSLSRASEITTSFGTYSFQGLANGKAVSLEGQQFSSSIRQDFHILVDGDLNEQEQADIQEFLNSANSIFEKLAEGNIDEASNTALSLGNLDTLSQAALFVRQSASVTVAAQSTELNVGQTHLNEGSEANNQTKPDTLGILEQVLNALQDTREQLQINPEQLANRVPNLVTHLLESLQQEEKDKDAEPTIFEEIRNELLQSLQDTTHLLNSQDNATELADIETQEQESSQTNSPPPIEPGLESLIDQNSLDDVETRPQGLTSLHV